MERQDYSPVANDRGDGREEWKEFRRADQVNQRWAGDTITAYFGEI